MRGVCDSKQRELEWICMDSYHMQNGTYSNANGLKYIQLNVILVSNLMQLLMLIIRSEDANWNVPQTPYVSL